MATREVILNNTQAVEQILDERLDGMSLKKINSSDYEVLETKEAETLYVVTES